MVTQAIAFLALAAGQSTAPPAKLGSTAQLKSDFNAAKGQTRLLFIWAPS